MPDPVSVTRSTYDEIAPAYAARNRTPYEGLCEQIARFADALPVGALVADVGCGPGREAALLRERGLAVVRLDLSMAMLRLGGGSPAAQADMRALPLLPASIDGLWCQAAMLHIPLADAPAVLAEFARVVRPGGRLHLMVAEGDDEGWQSDKYDGQRRWFAHHRVGRLSELLSRTGFHVHDVDRRSSHRDWLTICASRAAAAAGGGPTSGT